MSANDVQQKTVETYRSPEGAAAYIAKEQVTVGIRTGNVWNVIEGIGLLGKKVLDVGCGFGRDVLAFREQGVEAYGVDVSQPLLDEAIRLGGDKSWFAQVDLLGGQDIPFGGEFDMVWMCNVFVHVPREQMPNLLKRMVSWTKVGGILAIQSKEGTGEKVMTNLGETLPRLMVYYTVNELSVVLKEAGCEVEYIADKITLPFGDDRFALRARRVSA